MKYKDLEKKTKDDIKGMLKKLREELFHLKIKNKTGQLEKKSQIQATRRDIARLMTKMTELTSANS